VATALQREPDAKERRLAGLGIRFISSLQRFVSSLFQKRNRLPQGVLVYGDLVAPIIALAREARIESSCAS
jgi:hypothetical protein